MALGDVQILKAGPFGDIGSDEQMVQAGAVASIKAGELVLKTLGSQYVLVWTASNSAKPVAGTDFLAGYSQTTSTETASVDGTVQIMKLLPGQVFLGNPDVAATWDTQAEYDALVGDRVLLKTSAAGVQTILATDGATNGLVVEPLNVSKNPGKVAFAIRAACSYLA